MNVTAKFFSGSPGFDTRTVDLPPGATVGELLSALRQDIDGPAIARLAQSMVLVNHAKADHETSLEGGDEVLLLPLLPGG